MKNLIFPHPLVPGDRVALAAPASPVSPDALDTAVRSLRSIGLDPGGDAGVPRKSRLPVRH